MGVFSTGFIVLIVSIIGGVIGGVALCSYFYIDGKKKRQIRPESDPKPRMTEPFNTKKLWERGRKKAVLLTKENETGEIGESVNPSSSHVSPITTPVLSQVHMEQAHVEENKII